MPALILTVYGPPTAGGLIFTCQRRSAPATPLTVAPAISTLTVEPGSAQPQMVFSLPRCKTILSVNIGLTSGNAFTAAGAATEAEAGAAAGVG